MQITTSKKAVPSEEVLDALFKEVPMKRILQSLLAILCIWTNEVVPARADEQSQAARSDAARPADIDSYRSQELHARYSFWKGMKVTRSSQDVDLGYFGGNASALFAGSPSALESMSTFRALRISGTLLYVAGLATLITGLVLIDGPRGDAGEGILLGGLAAGLAGAAMVQGANGYLSDAIEQYNQDLYRRLRGSTSQPRSVGFSLSRSW